MKLRFSFLFPFLLGINLSAQSLPLDSIFGVNGILRLKQGFSTGLRDVELLPDGNLLLAGTTNDYVYLARYLPDGSPDQSFGNQGILPFYPGNVGYHNDLLPLSDGKIVSISQGKDVASPFQTPLFAVARFNADGSPDSTFGQVSRLLPDGNLDPAFGVNGVTSPWFGYELEAVSDLAVLADGRILLVGYISGSADDAFALFRLHADGTPDITFGDNGIKTFSLGFENVLTQVDVLPDGRFIALGHFNEQQSIGFGAPTQSVVFCFLPDGSPDTSFNGTGLGTLLVDYDNFCTKQILQPDGSLLIGGGFYETDTTAPHSFLARLLIQKTSNTADPEWLEHIGVSPNPAAQQTELHFSMSQANSVQVSLLNAGLHRIKTIASQTRMPAGNYKYPVDVSMLPAGIYYLVVEGNEGIKFVPLIKTAP
ncbi:MAG: hypothetical protein H7246_09390 [Phycisphaerae bacterium]|nr:hypothetical protein [Saprospiraceae bacterium]